MSQRIQISKVAESVKKVEYSLYTYINSDEEYPTYVLEDILGALRDIVEYIDEDPSI